MIGNTADTAPSACVEINRPIQMLAIVCDADCSTLLSINGTRNTSRSRHIGRLSSKTFTPGRRPADACAISYSCASSV